MKHSGAAAAFALMVTVVLLLMVAAPSVAQRLPGPPEEEARLRELALGLRCPVCQSENIFESQSPVAREMMVIAQEQIRAGRTDDEIRRFFRDRYGDYVLLSPPTEGSGLIVWALPLVLAAGALLVFLRQSTRRRRPLAPRRPPLTEARLEELEP